MSFSFGRLGKKEEKKVTEDADDKWGEDIKRVTTPTSWLPMTKALRGHRIAGANFSSAQQKVAVGQSWIVDKPFKSTFRLGSVPASQTNHCGRMWNDHDMPVGNLASWSEWRFLCLGIHCYLSIECSCRAFMSSLIDELMVWKTKRRTKRNLPSTYKHET